MRYLAFNSSQLLKTSPQFLQIFLQQIIGFNNRIILQIIFAPEPRRIEKHTQGNDKVIHALMVTLVCLALSARVSSNLEKIQFQTIS